MSESSTPISTMATGGRAAAIARRRALSAGKAALPPAAERVRTGERSAAVPMSAAVSAPAAAPSAPSAPAAPRNESSGAVDSCRQQNRARRARLSAQGRGAASPAVPSRPPRDNSPPRDNGAPRENSAPGGSGAAGASNVLDFVAPARQSVTSSRSGTGSQVTGSEAGAHMPVSGTQYVGALNAAAAYSSATARSGGPKVGLSRTANGGLVSGTMTRSNVPVTGDEAGNTINITGEAEQRPQDDVTERRNDGAQVSAQFQRQADPHGQTVFGTNLGRSARHIGSRERPRDVPLETTESGIAITGRAVGRCGRVTGDESSTSRFITGDQYMNPAGAPSGAIQGSGVTGDTPIHGDQVTGTARGAARSITGTPYYRDGAAAAPVDDPVAAINARFSVRSPQRAAHLEMDRTVADDPNAASRITGSCAVGGQNVTGNREFVFRPRHSADVATKPAHARMTGEGRTAGLRISGESLADQKNVTGTDGFIAVDRNPSAREGKPLTFAGAGRFKELAVKEEHRQLVTGMFGWSSGSAAKVTLSGGAQG